MNNSDIIKILIQSSNTKNTAQNTERKKKTKQEGVEWWDYHVILFMCKTNKFSTIINEDLERGS